MRFDHVILTAANETQARGYEAQIRWRQAHGSIEPACRVHVAPDPGGRRVGSLGATVNALRVLAEVLASEAPAPVRNFADLFRGRRILICHSGGDGRRTPAYSAQGKVFVPLPVPARNGQGVALFDLMLSNLESLPVPRNGHVLIAVGDVLLTFDPAAVNFEAPGVVGVAYPGPIERGSQHGVYVTDSPSFNAGLAPVRDFLQKPDAETASRHKAMDSVGRVLIDTGLLSLSPEAVAGLMAAAGCGMRRGSPRTGSGLLADLDGGECPSLDLYEDFTMALAPAIGADAYLARGKGGTDARHRGRLRRFRDAVRRIPFAVNVLPYCDFFHVGTSRDLLVNFSPLTRTAETYRFANFAGSALASGASTEGSFVFNSIISHSRVRASRALLEAVDADGPVELPGRNILTGLPAGGGIPIRLSEGVGLVCLPVGRRDWAAVVYGIEDDFKTPLEQGERSLFLNRPIAAWMRRNGLKAGHLWKPGIRRDLWEARLWVAGTLDVTLRHALALQSGIGPGFFAGRGRRFSMAQLLRLVNHDRLLAHRQDILRRACLAGLGGRILSDDRLSSESVNAQILTRSEARAALEQLRGALNRRPEPLFRARVYRIAQDIAANHRLPAAVCRRTLGCASPAAFRTASLAAVSEAVARSAVPPEGPRPAAILPDQVVWTTTPVRLDFSGGWSDTPPLSTELGGTVLNAAVTLNGQYPVQVMAKLNEERVINLSSIDLGQRVTIRRAEDLLDCHDPAHWAALPKAALLLAGVAPHRKNVPLRRWLDVLGGGLDLTIFSALPKGSGLGTSSILGAAVLACLGRVLGEAYSPDRIIKFTSALEQYMATGGGWQDQIGGILPGVKLIRTHPGADQAVSLNWTVFDLRPGSPLRQRTLLYFTGQKRMARDILHNIVGHYLARDPRVLRTVEELKEAALQMKADLDACDVDAFARGIERYWTLKKQIDPGSTNPAIERILKQVERWTAARLLPGAGGGGFIFFVAKDDEAAGHIRRSLTARPPNRLARFFDFDVDQTGLRVTVL